jgi:hypothetical protein
VHRHALIVIIDLEHDSMLIHVERAKVVFLIRIVRVAKVVEHRDRPSLRQQRGVIFNGRHAMSVNHRSPGHGKSGAGRHEFGSMPPVSLPLTQPAP